MSKSTVKRELYYASGAIDGLVERLTFGQGCGEQAHSAWERLAKEAGLVERVTWEGSHGAHRSALYPTDKGKQHQALLGRLRRLMEDLETFAEAL